MVTRGRLSDLPATLALIVAAVRAQLQMSRRNIEDLFPILTIPLSSFIALAVLRNAGRDDLAGYALVGMALMSVGQMSVFVASEILANERQGQVLELVVASPTACIIPLLTRITVLTAAGMLGLVEAWVLARVIFGIGVTVYHPAVLGATLLLTVAAASATSLITTTVFCFGKTTRTYQNAVAGPLYLLGGVLVPVSYLPETVQPVSRLVYFYWAADLLRDTFRSAPLEDLALRLGALGGLGLAGGVAGAWMLHRLLGHLRREGTLGL